MNRLSPEDRPAHDWYRFVLSFPPHLVRHYLHEFGLAAGNLVLDPFCGTGTTLVECRKQGINSAGIEPNSMALFACSVKADWRPDPRALREHAQAVANRAADELSGQGIADEPAIGAVPRRPKQLRTLPSESLKLLLSNSISPLPLHKTLVLLDQIGQPESTPYASHERLALAKALVTTIGNLHFGPEVGVGPAKPDVCVLGSWLREVRTMAQDLEQLHQLAPAQARVCRGDARQASAFVGPGSIDAVITSPPYPNEKDYTRTTRLESVLLGFLSTRADLRALKQGLLRSNTRTVYKGDDDDRWVARHPEIQRIAEEIEARRIALNKTSGFERMYARVTRLYFGGMRRHLADLRPALREGAMLAYVVGDQASFLRVMIRTGAIIADLAQSLGYEVVRTDLFRTRLATATREQLREEVLVLRWPGERS